MARQTRHVMQAFVAGKGTSLKAEPPIVCKTAEEAERRARTASGTKLGVIAFSTSGDPETGDYDEQPTILFKAGRVSAVFEE